MNRDDLIKILVIPLLLFIIIDSKAQCPDNIGFENGTFKNWVISYGSVSNVNGSIDIHPVDSFYRVNLLKNSYPQVLDPFGRFPVNCPNGSNYSIKLGDSSGHGYAQSVSYTFTIPPDQDNYSIIYNYAVVLQEPGHSSWQQPSFSSKVFDMSTNKYIDCGSFTFVASYNLPGFELSDFGDAVYYKTWSPISIKLAGYAGKTVRLEFTTHDCSFGPHFGYAYIDVDQNCGTSISGNTFCNNSGSMRLTGPPGFNTYQWYDNTYTHLLDSSSILKLNPLPKPGDIYNLIITPFPGLGCTDTLHTTIKLSNYNFKLQTVDSVVSCSNNPIDLTAAFVTAGSTTDMRFSYFKDSSLLNYAPTPKYIKQNGIYYIKAENSIGCNDTKPVSVMIYTAPSLHTIDQSACGFVSINAPTAFNTDQTGLINSFWKDANATIPIDKPDSIIASGKYFIKVTNQNGCNTTDSIKTIVYPYPYFSIAAAPILYYPTQLNLTSLINPTTNTSSVINYWLDAAATKPVSNPTAIINGGTYYINASSPVGCVVMDSVLITVKVIPINPPNVFSPNRDGINDQWNVPELFHFPDCTVEVFNRYGQLVYRSKGYQNNWDGTFNNQPLPVGTYYYIIKTAPGADPIAGSVSIMR
jgi:gliding motility-associated-like protein